MKTTNTKRLLSFILCAVLIAAMALFTGCGDNKKTETPENGTTASTEAAQTTVLGTGKTQFDFTVKDIDGNETKFEIHTDKTVVGDALTELGLIEGDEGAYGLYVKKVNGITADYDKDGTYWAFLINGEMAPAGVDATEITEGAVYSFEVSK